MLAAARAILGCEHHAWDAVQEALLSLWHEPRLPANLRAWLLRTVCHRSMHIRRGCQRRRRREERVARQRGECTCSADPATLADARELLALVARACGQLPDELRQVFYLREMAELDYEAIARRMAIPIGTVRSRLSRVRAALRDLLVQPLALNN
jgi:RNA polymerase sigma-70 factor (ECF subfamily)